MCICVWFFVTLFFLYLVNLTEYVVILPRLSIFLCVSLSSRCLFVSSLQPKRINRFRNLAANDLTICATSPFRWLLICFTKTFSLDLRVELAIEYSYKMHFDNHVVIPTTGLLQIDFYPCLCLCVCMCLLLCAFVQKINLYL